MGYLVYWHLRMWEFFSQLEPPQFASLIFFLKVLQPTAPN
jgi:hypothetical protein